MEISKYIKHISYVIFCITLISCTLLTNQKYYGYNGKVEDFNGPIIIIPSEDQEKDNLKMIRSVDSYNKFLKEENFHEEVPLTLLNFLFEDTKYELGKNYGEFYLLGKEYDYNYNNPFNFKDYTTIPVGLTLYKGRKCIVILHHGNFSKKFKNNITLKGNIKGYQLIDIRTGLEVKVDMKIDSYQDGVKIMSVHNKTFIK